MSIAANQAELERAAAELAEHDPVLASVIAGAGLPDLKPHHNYYAALVGEIIGQQLSVKAAAAIRRRFDELFGGHLPDPAAILEKSADDMRAAGLSWAKVKYIRDLAQHMLDGKIKFAEFDSLSNEEIIRELTAVKGIGEWTAHMFLMFCMGRLNVLATGDLGIRNGIQKLYGIPAPSPLEITALAEANRWAPYETVACWYIWEALDNKPKL